MLSQTLPGAHDNLHDATILFRKSASSYHVMLTLEAHVTAIQESHFLSYLLPLGLSSRASCNNQCRLRHARYGLIGLSTASNTMVLQCSPPGYDRLTTEHHPSTLRSLPARRFVHARIAVLYT